MDWLAMVAAFWWAVAKAAIALCCALAILYGCILYVQAIVKKLER